MPVLTADVVRKQIDSGQVGPLYLLEGDDEFAKAALATQFAGLVDEELRPFNVERIHAGELTTADRLAAGVASLVTACRTLPMMSPRRVVVVLQAGTLLVPARESAAATRALEELEELFTRPEPTTTLVLVTSAGIDRRSRIFRLLTREATCVECGVAVQDPEGAGRFVKAQVAAAGASIDPLAARLLVERGGLDVNRLRTEVERLLLYAHGQKSITSEDVRQLVGPPGLQDPWAMANAIEARDAGAALRQLALMLDAGDASERILGQLGWLVRTKFPTLAPGQVSSAVEALFRTDLDLKRSAGEPRVLLERLVVELCAGPRAGR
jgi:DNA polymerase III subunit delta